MLAMEVFIRPLFAFDCLLRTNFPATVLPLVDPGFVGFSEDNALFLTIYLLSGVKLHENAIIHRLCPISIRPPPLQPRQRHGFRVPRYWFPATQDLQEPSATAWAPLFGCSVSCQLSESPREAGARIHQAADKIQRYH
ncbi:hypothetical protein VTN96DRAFT_6429 [Rasamsonia emersonii]